ncbi:MAG: phage tail protein [Gammaproteobacteria bacterium]|nr:phage tail protein [Gammaproteobacteria bacterium]
MPKIEQFVHNGITIEAREGPPSMGPPGENVVAWVVTAPDKHDSVALNVPFRVADPADAALLDVTGDERGTGWHAATETLKNAEVPQYFIVVPEAEEAPPGEGGSAGAKGIDLAKTMANIIGGVDAATGRRTGIAALPDCGERPTLIAAPGFSHNKEVITPLAVMGRRLRCRVVVDGPSGSTQDAIALSEELGGEDTGYERVYMVDPMPAIYSRKAEGEIYVPPSTVAMGAIAAVKPWESPGNQGVLIQDVARVIDYNILDRGTDGDLLNSHGVSYFARTSMGGFSLIGNRTVMGKFISFVGLEDAIARKIEAASQRAMAKQLTKNFMEQEIKKVDLFMQNLVAAETIPGGRVYLHPDLNTAEHYKNGSWYIVVDYGRYSPNEHMIFHLNAADGIVEDFIEGVL